MIKDFSSQFILFCLYAKDLSLISSTLYKQLYIIIHNYIFIYIDVKTGNNQYSFIAKILLISFISKYTWEKYKMVKKIFKKQHTPKKLESLGDLLIWFTYINSNRTLGYFLLKRSKSTLWRNRIWKWQILLGFYCQFADYVSRLCFCLQSAVRLCSKFYLISIQFDILPIWHIRCTTLLPPFSYRWL